MKLVLTLLSLRLLTALVFACLVAATFFTGASLDSRAGASGQIKQDEKLKDPRSIAEGARLFAPNCSSGYCHGASGVGGGAPRLRGKGLDADYLFKTILNGIPGTAMPAFKTELSEERIWTLVAFIMSEVKENKAGPAFAPSTKSGSPAADDSTNAAKLAAAASLIGDAQAGKALFFDSSRQKSCRACHAVGGQGASIGPDLSKVGAKSAREIFLSIVLPREVKDSRFGTLTLTLKNGEKVLGIKKEEDEEVIRVYDIAELPAVLRTIQKSDLAKTEPSSESAMPKDYAAIYTIKQILDMVSYLKSSDPQAKPVTLSELF
jgi:putative heme-binding domain-containing protein